MDTTLLKVSASAHVIASYNKTLDKVTERFLGSRRLGTTGRGIGPTYADKMNRIGIRIQDLFDEKILQAKVEGVLELKNQLLTKIYNRRASVGGGDRRGARVVRRPAGADTSCDSGLLLNQALDRGETVLLEAGQATLLDVDHGTYPFVTSSSATAGGACTGSGHPADPARPGDRDREGVHDPGGRGAVPDRAERRRRRAPAQGRRRVRHHDRPAAPLRLVRHGDRALRRAGQRRHRLRAHQARRAHRARDGARSASPTTSTASATTRCRSTSPTSTTPCRSTRSCPAGGRTSPRPAPSTTCRPTRGPTSPAVEELSGARISAIGVGPDRDATIVVHDLL